MLRFRCTFWARSVLRHPLLSAICLPLLVCAACGGGEGDGDALKELAVPSGPSEWSELLHSPAYTGKLAVMFTEGSGVRLQQKKFTSITGVNLSTIESIRKTHGIGIERGIATVTDEEIQQARAIALQRGGSLTDWSLYYHLVVPNPDTADAVIDSLRRNPLVRFVHPLFRMMPTGSVTPDLSDWQQPYLQAGNGGLNITAGWIAGLTGLGVTVVDMEGNWNVEHEDLPIDGTDLIAKPLTGQEMYDIAAPATHHGTAVVGLIAGADNGLGVQGIAPSTKVKLAQASSDTDTPVIGGIIEWLIGKAGVQATPPGTILVIEAATPAFEAETCNQTAAPDEPTVGCVPLEHYQGMFCALYDAVANGIVVVEAAGNSGMDLAPYLTSMSTICKPTGALSKPTDPTDSGTILVGASIGPSLEKLPESNCGTRVDVFAWGAGVATSGYGDLNAQMGMGNGDNPNQWYTAQFGGTSAAAALIAGMAALAQEYARIIHGPEAYLDSMQMRQLFKLAGVGQEAKNTNGCAIGVQPDMGKVLQLLKDGVVKPHVPEEPLPPGPQQGTLAAPLDLDGDGRGDLIAWARAAQPGGTVKGKWYIDLSTKGLNADHFGSWDLVLDPDIVLEETTSMYFPVVTDYDTDGQADLALYDSVSGKWYIRYTDVTVLANSWGTGWNTIIDYSQDPNWQPYSRPVPGDYGAAITAEGKLVTADADPFTFDRWMDPALATPDGTWLIDVVTKDEEQQTGTVSRVSDQVIPFLTAQQLQWAPGWAYIPIVEASDDFDSESQTYYLSYATPPSVPDEASENVPDIIYSSYDSEFWPEPSAYLTDFDGGSFKKPNGKWDLYGYVAGEFQWVTDAKDFGGVQCRPMVADYDGDGTLDRSTLCPTEWRIEYSSAKFSMGADGLRHVAHTSNTPQDLVPGYVYPGGVAYQEVLELYKSSNYGCPSSQACTIFDLTKNSPPPIGPFYPVCKNMWGKVNLLECLYY